MGGFLAGVAGGLAGKASSYLKNRKKSGGSGDTSSSNSPSSNDSTSAFSMHKGGEVKKTGKYLLQKGEKVVSKAQRKKMAGKRMKGKC